MSLRPISGDRLLESWILWLRYTSQRTKMAIFGGNFAKAKSINLQQATVSGSSSDSSENPRKAVPWVAAAAENWNHMAVHGWPPSHSYCKFLPMLVQWDDGTGMGNVPTFTNSQFFSQIHPTFPTFTSLTHQSKEQKQTRKPLPWTAPSLRDHVPQAGVPSSWEKRQWTTSFPASNEMRPEKKLEKGPTRKAKNLFARASLQFACQDLWLFFRQCWEKCWVVGRNIDCSIMRDRNRTDLEIVCGRSFFKSWFTEKVAMNGW